MTPEDLRADIPVTDEVTYLNTGASGPSPRRVVDAVCDFQRYHEHVAPAEEGFYTAGWDAYEDAREAAAGFLNADPAAVALTGSTTDGINLIAGSIDWEPGDTVVYTDVEHPAGVLPWERLADTHGIETEIVEGDRGRFDVDDFADAVADARLVCLSSVAWNYGTRLPVGAVADLAHEADAMVLVDAVQSFGRAPIDPGAWGVDFLAASGHKWPLGPWGTGVLYLDADARDRLRPTRIGGRSVTDSAARDYEYKEGAAMFDLSTMPAAVYRGLETALETIDDVGFDAIRSRIERLADRLKDGIPDARLDSPREHQSGLVSFDVDDPEGFVERLAADDIVIRDIPYPECVRVSIHAFNTAAEIDAVLEHV